MESWLLAVQFLTRLPVPASAVEPSEEIRGRSVLFYPLVGLLIGLLLLLLYYLTGDSASSLQTVLILGLWVALTGALHLDGLADLADAWIGGQGERERTLEIMKDTHSGPIAVTALILLLLVKFVALEQLLEKELWSVLLLVPMLGRAGLVASLLTMPYVRADGLGAVLSANLPAELGRNVVIASALFSLLFLGWSGLLLLAALVVIYMLLHQALMKRLGGVTGDAAGAVCEILEATALVALALMI
ncbi:MAG: adenosylcobinamide-GDP ribazoletransferase [Candidatus Sedimenticola sp. (ex Thyasira tokunagai)]